MTLWRVLQEYHKRVLFLMYNIFDGSGHGGGLTYGLGYVSIPLPLKLTSSSRSNNFICRGMKPENRWSFGLMSNVTGWIFPKTAFDFGGCNDDSCSCGDRVDGMEFSGGSSGGDRIVGDLGC